MSYLYRPTPVFSPGLNGEASTWTALGKNSGAVSGGVMHGFSGDVNWKAYFDSSRAATQGKPWIVSSGAMGNFGSVGDVPLDPLPLTPYDPGSISFSALPLPLSFWDMTAPIAPPIVPYDPGSVPAFPAIVSSGGSITSPVAQPGSSLPSVITAFSNLASSIIKTVNPLGTPAAPPAIAPQPAQQQSMVAQAQSLQAQANALQATNPALAAQYRAQANALLGGAGAPAGSTFAQWMSAPSSIFPALSNGGFVTLAGAGVLLLIIAGGIGHHVGSR
jgi:hypothetical protein